jgi:hypothetical protein
VLRTCGTNRARQFGIPEASVAGDCFPTPRLLKHGRQVQGGPPERGVRPKDSFKLMKSESRKITVTNANRTSEIVKNFAGIVCGVTSP